MLTHTHSSELVQWLWPTLIQQELNELRERLNNHVVRFDKEKKMPSGTSPAIAYQLHEEFGGENCLQAVDVTVVQELMKDLGGEELIQFVPPEYAARARVVFASLEIGKLSFSNIWEVFRAMLPLMS